MLIKYIIRTFINLIRVDMCISIDIHIYTIPIPIHTSACMHICIYRGTHTCTYRHTHIHMYTHILSYLLFSKLPNVPLEFQSASHHEYKR